MGIVRVLLAISVVLAHSTAILGTTLFGGRTAVECFFVISGFYMAMVWSGRYSKGGNWWTFMASRLARLLPVYLIILIASASTSFLAVALGSTTGFTETFDALSISGKIVTIASNVTLIGQDWLTFTAVGSNGFPVVMADPLSAPNRGAGLLLVPQAWSISIELAFYVLAPFILRLSTKKLIVLGLGSLAIRAVLAMVGLDVDPWTYRFFPAELIYFVLGAIAFRITRDSLRPPGWLGPMLLALLIIIGVLWSSLRDALPLIEPLFPFLFAFAVPYFFAWTKRNRQDRWIGELSYPLYLVHMLVAQVLSAVGLQVNGLTLSVTSLVAAAGILVVVAAPLEKLRQRRLAQTFAKAIQAPQAPSSPST